MTQQQATRLDAPGRVSPDAASVRPSLELSVIEELVWCVLAGVSYIGLSIWHKFLLNWIIGPLWLVGVMLVGPALTAALGRRRRR